MRLTILNSDPNHWLSVHRTGCAHLKRGRHWDVGTQFEWIEEHDSLESCAHSVASDFIQEGSMTEDESLQHVHFYPCVDLPLSTSSN